MSKIVSPTIAKYLENAYLFIEGDDSVYSSDGVCLDCGARNWQDHKINCLVNEILNTLNGLIQKVKASE